jgi:eukaryotic-like serine/threonine-protein kinase
LQPKEVFKPTDKPRRTVVDQKPKEATQVAKGSQVTLVIDSAAATGSSTTTSATTTTNDTTTTTSTSETTTSAATTATTPATPANATVPDVSGQAEQAAVTSFATAGVLASLVFVPSQDPLGTVVQQAKPSGTSVPYHAHVQLNLSRGPGEKPDVSVPDAVGQTLTQAVSTMNGAGLRLIFVKLPVTSAAQVGKIAQQSPLAGGKAPRNAQVLVFLGVKPS